jgi:hypothetical protein
MSSQPKPLQTKLDALWNAYLVARDKAATSGDMADGIAAGRAWSRWLSTFCPEGSVRDAVHGADVVQLRR